MGKGNLLQLLVSLLVSWAHGWQHASEAELARAVEEHTKPLLVTYVFSKEQLSQNLESHWARVQSGVKKQHIEADLISIDCSAALPACLALDVKAYPAIRLYHPDGRVSRYRGPRKSKAILAFLHRANRHTLSSLTTTEQVASFLSSDEVVFTAEFIPSEAPLYETHYRRLAERYHDRYSFGLVPSSIQSKIPQKPVQPTSKQSISKVKCYNAQSNDSFTLTSAELPLPNALNELLTQCTASLVYEPIGRKQLAELATVSATNAKSGLIVHFFVASGRPFTDDSEDPKELYKKEIAHLAKKYSHEILFTIIDGDEHHGMGPTVGGLPSDVGSGVSVENIKTGGLFPYLPNRQRQAAKLSNREDEETKIGIVAEDLEWFLGEIVEGKVQPWTGHKQPGGDTERKGLEGSKTGGHDEL